MNEQRDDYVLKNLFAERESSTERSDKARQVRSRHEDGDEIPST